MVPQRATNGNVSITTVAGTGTSRVPFNVSGLPTISSVTSSSGTAGSTVTISGTNFSATPANNTVKFNGLTASVVSATRNVLTVKRPSGAPGSGNIFLSNPNGTATAPYNLTSAGKNICSAAWNDLDLKPYPANSTDTQDCIYGFCPTPAMGCIPMDYMWGSLDAATSMCATYTFNRVKTLKQNDQCL
jgi:hypothetical protein